MSVQKASVIVQKTDKYWTVTERLIVDGHSSPITIHMFPKTEDGCVLIPICPRSKQTSKMVKICNVSLRADGGKVFVESTKKDYPSLKAELDFFCLSWYRQWILAKEGEYV